MLAAKALVSVHRLAPEPLLLTDAIITVISWTGLYELLISSPSSSVISLIIWTGHNDDK